MQISSFAMWIIGAVFTIIVSLIVYIWKTNKEELQELKLLYETHERSVNSHNARLGLIEQNCKQQHLHDVKEIDIRNIITTALHDFKTEFSKEITDRIKLTLLEEGYIAVPITALPPKPKRNGKDQG